MRTVTLTSANTNYGVDELLLAENAAERIHCQEVTFQAPTGNTAVILIGDGSLSATEFGYSLAAGTILTIRGSAGANSVGLNAFKVRSANAGQLLSITQLVV
jgi:hypothetical protein